jgi:hypothetical protein
LGGAVELRRLEAPERLHADEDEERVTASLSYADKALS